MKYCVSLYVSVHASSCWWTHTRLNNNRVGGQLKRQMKLQPVFPAQNKGMIQYELDKSWHSQKWSSNLMTITSSAYPLWHVGTRNYTTWCNYWWHMWNWNNSQIKRKIWSLCEHTATPNTMTLYFTILTRWGSNFCSGLSEVPLGCLSDHSYDAIWCGWMSVMTAVGQWSGVCCLPSLDKIS